MFIKALFTTVKDYSLYTHQIMNSLFKKKKKSEILKKEGKTTLSLPLCQWK